MRRLREESLLVTVSGANGDGTRAAEENAVLPSGVSSADQTDVALEKTVNQSESTSGSEPESPDPPSKAIKIEEGPHKDIVEMTTLWPAECPLFPTLSVPYYPFMGLSHSSSSDWISLLATFLQILPISYINFFSVIYERFFRMVNFSSVSLNRLVEFYQLASTRGPTVSLQGKF